MSEPDYRYVQWGHCSPDWSRRALAMMHATADDAGSLDAASVAMMVGTIGQRIRRADTRQESGELAIAAGLLVQAFQALIRAEDR